MKLKDVMQRAKCGVLGALVTMGLTAVAAEPEAVQLWEGGPYWATSNLGEPETWYADHPEYGALYTFDETDTAVKSLLGVEWRVPSWDDFKDLINRCNWAWSGAGFTFTGKGDYASHSIFFPAAGWDTGGVRRSVEYSGLYWSSTKVNSSYAYYLVGDIGGPGAYDSFRSHRMAVRAVRDTPPSKVMVDGVTPSEQWCKIKVDYTVIGKDDKNDYAIVFEVTADGRTASVTDGPAKLTNGAATKVIDTEKLFGRQIYDENAKVKVSLMKLEGARQLWEGGPYWAECNYNAIQPCDYGERLFHDDANNRVSAPWRVPSRRDFEALANNCNREKLIGTNSEGLDVVGCRFTGRGDFSSNSIFMPAGGCQYEDSELMNVGSIGYYWTCEYDWIPWRLSYYFAIYMEGMGAECRDNDAPCKMTVRAVRDTPPLVPVDTDEKEFGLVGLMPHIIPLEYVDADGTLRSRSVGEYELLTDNTATIRDGRWYAVTGTVSRGTITVNGSANIVLCDGAKLTVTGGANQPGIGVGGESAALTIYGQTLSTGELVAQGGSRGAGIGGGNCCMGGNVTINGGRVTATGGAEGAGIGGGRQGNGGFVTINGGTVTATCGKGASGIGGGKDGAGGVITINGGNVVASSLGTAPKNGAGKPLHKVTLNASDEVAPVFGGLDGYGLRGVVPVDGKYCFYLPDGSYRVSVGTAADPHGYYFFIVNGQDVVCNLQQLGLTVNGEDVGVKSGDGWTYGDNILKLNGSAGPYVLSGISTFDEVQVQAASDCTVDLSDAIIYTEGRPAFVVNEGVAATLRMKGGVSHLAATNAVGVASVPAIEVKGTLSVDFAPDAEIAQSAIYAFNFGDRSAIGGSGEVSVVGGHLCAWSDDKAIGADCDFHLAESSYGKMIGQVGDDWDDVALVGSGYLAESKFYEHSKVEVAPAYRVFVPDVIDHVGKVTVSNSWQKLLHDNVGAQGAWTNRYFAMLDDTVTVNFEVEAGYVLVGANPLVIPLLTNDVVVLPDVRRPLTVTLPKALEGETYVVKEAGVEVEGEVEVEGKRTYPVRSGYDIEIVCTAQEDWRIVSETNVVTIANIQESRVLSAADLPRAWRLFNVMVPAVAHVTNTLTSTDSKMWAKGSGTWQVLSNAEVTVTFYGVGNYRVAANGAKTWTLTGDVTFGTTEGFPLPTVEGIPGTVAAPWSVGENVQAYTNGAGVLTITGTGAMDDFASVAYVPWDPAAVTAVAIGEGVTKVGKNSLVGLADTVTVDGTALSVFDMMAGARGFSEGGASPSGAISPAEFEQVQIVDGKAYLGVSVYTNSEVKVIGEGGGWGVATNGVITVPAPGKQGFFYLMSKPAAPSDARFISPILKIGNR